MDKIICVGKNYLDHAKELGDAVPEKPVIFLKPPSVLRQASAWHENLELSLPRQDDNIHYECEVVLRITKKGDQSSISAVTLGLDMTKRTLQASSKKNGHPWTTAKVFIDSAVIGPWIPLSQFPHYMETSFSLSLQHEMRQQAKPKEMMTHPLELISYISEFFPLCEDDLIFTGTPAGVGAIQTGSTVVLKWGDYQYSVTWR